MQIGNSPFLPKTRGTVDPVRFFQGMKDGDILTAKVLSRTGTKGQFRLLMNGKAVTLAISMDVEPGQEFRFSFVRGKNGMELKFLSFQDGKQQDQQPISPSMQKHGQTIGQKLLQQLEEHIGPKNTSLPQASNDKGGQVLLQKNDQGQVMGSGNADFSSFAAALSKGRNLHALFSRRPAALEQIFSAIALQSDSPDKDFMPKLISLGGLMMEKKMASFLEKPQFSQLHQLFSNLVKEDAKAQALSMAAGGMEAKDGLVSAGAEFADTMESLQVVNSQTSDSGRYFIPFPIANAQGFSLGQLFVDLNGKQDGENGGKDRKNIRIAFLLSMSRLGAVRADFSILDRAITGRFLFEKEESCSHVRSMIPDLGRQLAKVGFHDAGMDCMLAKPKDVDSAAFMDSCLQTSSDPDTKLHIVI